MKSLLPTTAQGASSGAELVTSDGRSLALVAAKLRGVAQGGIGRLVLEQTFANTFEENLRVTYRMPLPADGAVSGYEFVIGERTIRGVVDRKRAAREKFERAIASGHTAALLEQERADIFTQQIGNIPPKETIVAKITIDQRLVWLPEGEWELRFPTVIGPRYIGSADTVADIAATHIKVTDQPLKASIQIELSIKDAIVAGQKPQSPSHQLEKHGDWIELKSGARLDRDIVVRWPVATPSVGMSLDCARPETGDDMFALLTVVPPAAKAKAKPVPRDLIVLLDTSGSMDGGPLGKAKQVVALMIDSLDESDRLELIEFSNEPRRYLPEPVVATARAKQDAIRWVRSRKADGGTEMRAAVIEALQTLRIGAQRQVVVVTDGYVGGEQQILAALHSNLPKSCRLHVLGVGSAVNRSIATSLARAGRGAEVIVGVDEDAERGAKRLLDRTRMPMLTNVEIAGSALLRHAPEQVPDVFEGAPLVAALALRGEGGELVVRGQLAGETWEQRMTVAPKRPGDGNQAIVALYGRERVADVESHAMFDSVDGEIEDLGLTFQIATRMTSWIAVDETRVVKGPSRDQVIPQELPYGTKAESFGLRRSSGPGRGFGDALQSLGELELAAPAMMQDIEELGEEAPSEVFADEKSMVQRIADEDDFIGEEPTGQKELETQSKGGFGGRSSAPVPSAPRPVAENKARPAPASPVAKSPSRELPKPAQQPAEGLKVGSIAPPEGYLERKKEAAQQQDGTPQSMQRKRSPWPLILIAFLLLVAALIFWWFLA